MKEEDAFAQWLGEHGYLVMSTYSTYERGQLVDPIYDFSEQKRIGQPFVVLEETTEEEYVAQCEWVREQIKGDKPIKGRRYYYRISTD